VRLRRTEDGFTLIELLIVLVVIGILLSIAVASFLGFRERAENRASQATLREAVPSAHAYYIDNENSFSGMNETILKSQFDAGLSGVVVQSADDDSYCLRSTLNDNVWYGSGPPIDISQTAC
jgi:type IV pilus assembly protein PilA